MPDPALDHAARALRADGRIAMTMTELAATIRFRPGELAILERRLREDDRFVVLDRVNGLPGLEHWPADRRAAYDPAFRSIGLSAPHIVLLAAPAVPPQGDRLIRLLHGTVLALAGTRGAPAAAAAAERLRGPLASITPTPGAAAPTTTLPPGPPPPS